MKSEKKLDDKFSPDLGDWRLMIVGWITAIDNVPLDEPKCYRGSTWFQDKTGNEVSFPTPSAAALHLNAAWKASKRAQAIKDGLMVNLFNANGMPTLQASEERIPALFDYFEEMMAVAFNSFGAIEAFCNQTVVEKGGDEIKVLVKKKERVSKTPEEIEREHSTDEKLGRIVPDLLGMRTPRGMATWDTYLEIKRIRDAVTHFKRRDQMRHADQSNEPTALLALYQIDCFKLPENTMKVLRHFHPAGAEQRWMMNPAWKRDFPGTQTARSD
jgi:hypothetical protein